MLQNEHLKMQVGRYIPNIQVLLQQNFLAANTYKAVKKTPQKYKFTTVGPMKFVP